MKYTKKEKTRLDRVLSSPFATNFRDLYHFKLVGRRPFLQGYVKKDATYNGEFFYAGEHVIIDLETLVVQKAEWED